LGFDLKYFNKILLAMNKAILIFLLLFSLNIQAKEYQWNEICPRYIDSMTALTRGDTPLEDLYKTITNEQRLERAAIFSNVWQEIHNALPRLSPSEIEYVEKERKDATGERLLELFKKKEWRLYEINNDIETVRKILDDLYSSINDGDVKKEIYHIISLRIGFEDRIDSLIQMHEYGYIKLYGSDRDFWIEDLKSLCSLTEDLYFAKILLEKL
tara:strand:- start:432 stop:1070 length:639 start_codon:yes stop_codon:yes gene_type:complete